mmetsp:Transcript_9346/g.16266  ORF Transcript_9346/g.16266 Transcript_9346/m.16266 type:complete len:413 (+) Transcript_9346:792-2030(+)
MASASARSCSSSASFFLLASDMNLVSKFATLPILVSHKDSWFSSFFEAEATKTLSSASSVVSPFRFSLLVATVVLVLAMASSAAFAASTISALFTAFACAAPTEPLTWPGRPPTCFSSFRTSSWVLFASLVSSCTFSSSSTFRSAIFFSLANLSACRLSSIAFSRATPIITFNLCKSVFLTPLPPSATRTVKIKSKVSTLQSKPYRPFASDLTSFLLRSPSLSVSNFVKAACCFSKMSLASIFFVRTSLERLAILTAAAELLLAAFMRPTSFCISAAAVHGASPAIGGVFFMAAPFFTENSWQALNFSSKSSLAASTAAAADLICANFSSFSSFSLENGSASSTTPLEEVSAASTIVVNSLTSSSALAFRARRLSSSAFFFSSSSFFFFSIFSSLVLTNVSASSISFVRASF